MSTPPYDPRRTAEYFDDYGDNEWKRFESGRTPEAGLDIHVRFLERFVRAGDRVLDAGAGPGRFTLELVRLGADAVALDVSAVQLELLRQRLPDVETIVGDVTDLSRFADRSFDVTVCYGGPLSYVLDRADDALAELVRVTRSGGYVLVSVMSTIGAQTHFIHCDSNCAPLSSAPSVMLKPRVVARNVRPTPMKPPSAPNGRISTNQTAGWTVAARGGSVDG
jgi:SAM-dependent methyltransferase